ncbi:interleukin-11 receptor subunit alpha [Anguilla anguilla]|uniref:interleukin-11 receptor subunit alpha n=1 Tax=Anguilla anguilla TaxID=7936 RepID=UPI0015A8D8F4|nr:interleukin-11 receptor subunit alpha [Anguilla anguilla]XP_035246447.1 interleukin-11 receptor subunit alpha [Anguilla anguilla]
MPGKTSCPGGLIVIGIISLCAVHVSSEIWSNEVSDIEYGKLGSNVTLVCKPSWTGSPVAWRLNGSATLPRQAVSSNGSLTLVNTDLSMEGNYSCLDQGGDLLWATKLRLGHMPGLVSVSFKMSNHHSVQCFWKQPAKSHLPTKYITSYSDRVSRVEPCHQDSVRPNECTIQHPTLWHHYHMVNITEVNPLGAETTLVRVQFDALLKPDPPEAVTPEPVEGQPSRLRVSWTYPSSWPRGEAYTLLFQVRYRPRGSVNWSLLNTTKTTLLITDALVGHAHVAQVQAMDELKYGHWSDWSAEAEAMPWTEPESSTLSPTIWIGLFTDGGGTVIPTGAEVKTDENEDEYTSLGVLISLGLFAGLILSTLSALVVFLGVRQRRRDEMIKQELTSMVKMKSLPI